MGEAPQPVILKLAIRLRIVTPLSVMEEVAEGLHGTTELQ